MILGGELPTSTIPAWGMFHVSCGRSPLAVSGRAPESRRFNRFLGEEKNPEATVKWPAKWWCRDFSQRKIWYHGISWYIHELMGLELYFLMRKIGLSWLIMAYLSFIWCKMMINHEMVEGYPFRETKDAKKAVKSSAKRPKEQGLCLRLSWDRWTPADGRQIARWNQ